MKNKQKHTPTPDIAKIDHELRDILHHSYISDESAAYIVRAVNCHEDLVKVAAEILRLSPSIPKYIVELAVAAIAKLEEK